MINDTLTIGIFWRLQASAGYLKLYRMTCSIVPERTGGESGAEQMRISEWLLTVIS